jgi:DHA1 family bicyclomycin/chloramphenicol resistance-like MFS transporter
VKSRNPARTFRVGEAEFVMLIAFISALNAIAIDVMLPAFGAVRQAFGLAPDATEVSLIVTAYLAGLGLGQYFFGPITDAYGRKPILYGGVVLYLTGAVGTILAPTLSAMIVFRLLWGLGAAGPRVVSFAVVRDRYRGDEMARVFAIVTGVFMIVPAVAPTIGQAMLSLGSWRYPFLFSALFAAAVGLWSVRLRETLPPTRRIPLSFRNTVASTREVLRHRTTTLMMVGMMFGMAAFFPYLGSGQLIYDEIYGRASQFPYWFGLTAVFMAAASLTTSRLISRLGSWKVLRGILSAYSLAAITFVTAALMTGGRPSFATFYSLATVLIVGVTTSRAILNSLALEDVGHVAGTASALIGTVTLFGGSLLGSLVDRTVSTSVTPFAAGFLVFGLLMVAFVVWAGRGER